MGWLQGFLFDYDGRAKALRSMASCSGYPMMHLGKHLPMSLGLLLYEYRSSYPTCLAKSSLLLARDGILDSVATILLDLLNCHTSRSPDARRQDLSNVPFDGQSPIACPGSSSHFILW